MRRLSIAAVSAATGVPVETIRSWERRYGFPEAERNTSGRHEYDLAVVPRLRLISAALALGPAEADVVPASEPALEAFLAGIPSIKRLDAATALRGGPGAHELFGAIRSFDAEQLQVSFEGDWAQLGPLRFVSERAAPFLASVGDAWEKGDLHVRHEHFASACLGDFLRTARMPMDDRATGPVVVLSTLPDELHGLGLQMAAVVSAAVGWRVLMLGTNTPLDQVEALTREASVGAVAISCALPRRRRTRDQLRALRRRLRRNVPLIVGGAGAPARATGGVEIMADFPAFDAWLRERA